MSARPTLCMVLWTVILGAAFALVVLCIFARLWVDEPLGSLPFSLAGMIAALAAHCLSMDLGLYRAALKSALAEYQRAQARACAWTGVLEDRLARGEGIDFGRASRFYAAKEAREDAVAKMTSIWKRGRHD